MGFDTASTALETRPVSELVEDLDRARGLGANTVRFALRWDWLEREPGTLDPAHAAEVDRLLAAARERDLGTIVTLVFTPCWASSAPRTPSGGCDPAHSLYPPSDPAAYEAFVRRVVTRWGKGLAGVEVWNEPNHTGFWRGSPGDYLALVRAAAEGVRTSPYADLPVVGGAVSLADTAYLRQLLDAGLARWTDAVSIHPYDLRWEGAGFGDPSVARPNDVTSFAFAVPQVRSLMDEYDDPDPIWITEFGYADCPATPYCVAPEEQADYLRKAAELAATWSYVDAFVVYRLRDWLPQDGGFEARFGILNQDGSPKPAAQPVGDVFRRLTP